MNWTYVVAADLFFAFLSALTGLGETDMAEVLISCAPFCRACERGRCVGTEREGGQGETERRREDQCGGA